MWSVWVRYFFSADDHWLQWVTYGYTFVMSLKQQSVLCQASMSLKHYLKLQTWWRANLLKRTRVEKGSVLDWPACHTRDFNRKKVAIITKITRKEDPQNKCEMDNSRSTAQGGFRLKLSKTSPKLFFTITLNNSRINASSKNVWVVVDKMDLELVRASNTLHKTRQTLAIQYVSKYQEYCKNI